MLRPKRRIWPPLHERMGKSILVGLSLTLIGLALFLIAWLPVTRIDEVIDTSFALTPGTNYGPYDAGTVYHTRVFVFKSVLRGEITVEGEGVYLTMNGWNVKNLQNTYVKGEKSFMIEPANEQYTFTFDNTHGSIPSLVRFRLTEVWTASFSPLMFVLGIVGLFLSVPSGIATLAMYFRSKDSSISMH